MEIAQTETAALNCVGGQWSRGGSTDLQEVFNPTTSEVLARVQMASREDVNAAAKAAARKFRYEAPAGTVGVNIGVAVPMAYFPFSGWKDIFLDLLHGQGRDGVEFYTDKKVVVERWPREWSRKF